MKSFQAEVDNRKYRVNIEGEFFAIDTIAHDLATQIAHKIYGKRKGKTRQIKELNHGREPYQYWSYEIVIAAEGKFFKIEQWQSIEICIREVAYKPPKTRSPQPPPERVKPTLAETLDLNSDTN
ncbi:hypothetical protein [Chamaesiphon sp.]|uniref:hypothetical protein n=1 Tax=Chamaesiphon sp. TaxID=2814140 RepID=UPI003593EC50